MPVTHDTDDWYRTRTFRASMLSPVGSNPVHIAVVPLPFTATDFASSYNLALAGSPVKALTQR